MTEAILSSSRQFTIKDDVVARHVGEEVVLLDLESGTYFSLNGVGAIVWLGLERKDSLESIAATVVDGYDVDFASAHNDIAAFLEAMAGAGILVAS